MNEDCRLPVPRKSKSQQPGQVGSGRIESLSKSIVESRLGQVESGTQAEFAMTAHKSTNKRRANQVAACPSWLLSGVRDERLQRVGRELGRNYDYDHVNGA